jgi:hypothetical protein
VLRYEGILVAFAKIENKSNEEINIFYVDFRCSIDSDLFSQLTINGTNMFISHGRMMWCSILKYIYSVSNKQSFIVFNETIPESYGYHIKMGMKNFLPDEHNTDIAEYIKNEIDPKSANLFYFSNPKVNYSNIINILLSLEGSSKMYSDMGNLLALKKTYSNKRAREPDPDTKGGGKINNKPKKTKKLKKPKKTKKLKKLKKLKKPKKQKNKKTKKQKNKILSITL